MTVRMLSFLVSETMSLIGVEHELEFFSEVYEFINELNSVLQVNIIIHCSVSKEKDAFKFMCMGHNRAESVAFFVL